MSANAEKIFKEALNLPPQDRAEVLQRLLATFQEPPECNRRAAKPLSLQDT